jgi:potassium/hydrogen antiporter
LETAIVIFSVGLLIFLAHFFTALFNRTKIPDVLPLLLLGVLFGPLLDLVKPESFGKVGSIFTIIALIIILFQSGLGLSLSQLKSSLGRGLILTVVNYFFTLGLVALLAKTFLPLTPLEAIILGSILGGTSSAVVIPMIEKISLNSETKATLLLESTFSDVFCIAGTLGLLQASRESEVHLTPMVFQILSSFFVASFIGALGALLWSFLLRQIRKLENSTFTTPAFVFLLYGATEMLGHNGAIAALAFGIILGNASDLPFLNRIQDRSAIALNDIEKNFFAESVFLLKTFFFVFMGLSLRFDNLLLFWEGFILVGALFLLRILVVKISLPKREDAWDSSVAAIMNPKGLAAAVLAGLPLAQGLAGGAIIQSAVYSVVLFSILATAILVFLLNGTTLKKFYSFILVGKTSLEKPKT